MERYESRCVACGHRWFWTGFKTTMGKTPAQIEQMKNAGKTCPACGGIAKVGLDHESPQAQALDGALRDVVGEVVAKREPAEPAETIETTQVLGHASGRYFDVVGWVLSPLSGQEETAPSPKVPFHVGQMVVIQKIGWRGMDHVAEIRGEHVRVEATMSMFGEQRPLWFHYTELVAG